MKQIFDELRENIKEAMVEMIAPFVPLTERGYGKKIAFLKSLEIIDKAETKWEEELENFRNDFNSTIKIRQMADEIKRMRVMAEETKEEDCCEWKKNIYFFGEHYYLSSCGTKILLNSLEYHKYCPYCGKRIKINEVE